MVNQSTKNLVWQCLLDTASYRRYYGILEKRCNDRYKLMRFFMGCAGLFSIIFGLLLFTKFAQHIPFYLTPIGYIIIVMAVVWELVSEYGPKAVALRIATLGLFDAENKYRILYDEVTTGYINEDEARKRLNDLQISISYNVRGINHSINEELFERCQNETAKAERKRYEHG